MIDQLSATADCCQQMARGLRAIADDRAFILAVGCNLEDRSSPTCSALCSPKPLVFLNARFPVSFPLCPQMVDIGHGVSVAVHCDRFAGKP